MEGEGGASSALADSSRTAGIKAASSEMRSLMLSRLLRSTALCDSRLLRRFSVRSAACFCVGSSGTSSRFLDPCVFVTPNVGALEGTPLWPTEGRQPDGSVMNELADCSLAGMPMACAVDELAQSLLLAEKDDEPKPAEGKEGIDIASPWDVLRSTGAVAGIAMAVDVPAWLYMAAECAAAF